MNHEKAEPSIAARRLAHVIDAYVQVACRVSAHGRFLTAEERREQKDIIAEAIHAVQTEAVHAAIR